MSDIVKRLRRGITYERYGAMELDTFGAEEAMKAAAGEIERLTAERDALSLQVETAKLYLKMMVGGQVYSSSDGFSSPYEPEQSRLAKIALAKMEGRRDG